MAVKRKPPPGNVRRVVCLGHNSRGVTTNKRGRLVQFESEQERKLILLLERDPSVADYASQPETLHFLDADGRKHRYTPDFQVWRVSGQIELHEVTLEARRRARPSLPERETAAKATCAERGWCYVVHTDQTLPSGYAYTNLDFLAPFRAACYLDEQTRVWWIEQLADGAPVHPQRVLAQAGRDQPVSTLLNGLYHLLWHGTIAMNWDRPLLWRGAFHPGALIWLASSQEVTP